MVNKEDIRSALGQALITNRPEQWTVEFNFLESGVDGLDHATYLFSLEEKFNLYVYEDNVGYLFSIQTVLAHAEENQLD